MPAKFVIHTVGPVWNGGSKNEAHKLADCYRNSMRLALENDCKSVAFPGISTGIYRFPTDKAAEIAVRTVSKFLKGNETEIDVTFVCFDGETLDFVQSELNQL